MPEDGDTKQHLGLRLEPRTIDRIERVCEEKNLTKSQFVRGAIRRRLNQEQVSETFVQEVADQVQGEIKRKPDSELVDEIARQVYNRLTGDGLPGVEDPKTIHLDNPAGDPHS